MTAPVVSGRPRVAVVRKASKGRRATTLTFALTQPAKVTVRLARGRRCSSARCRRYVSYGEAIRSSVKDTRSVVVRLGSLPKGRYTVRVTPAGGKAVTVSFTVR